MDVDIGSSAVANGVLGLVFGVVTTLVVDTAFLIQVGGPFLPDRLFLHDPDVFFYLSSFVISSQPLHQHAVRLISASAYIEFRTSDVLFHFLFHYSSFLFFSSVCECDSICAGEQRHILAYYSRTHSTV